VLRARSGDASAFGDLYRHYRPLVEGLVRAEWRGADDVADLVQEIFERAWGQLDGLRDPERFRPWLFQIARRIVIDHARRDGRRPREQHGDGAIDDCQDLGPAPVEVAEGVELLERLGVAMAHLSPRDAEVIRLTALDGLDTVELAAAIDVAPGTAKVVLHRARRRLRDLVA
jgi:RNA polymerase sigma-70 factor (ECF subfamily)